MLRRALRNLLRAWRGGELALLAFSLMLAVSIVSGVAGFSERLQAAMATQSRHFLAADRVLKSSRPVPDSWLDAARGRGLRVAETVRFRSVLIAGENMQLASVKAASNSYPLVGQLQSSQRIFGGGEGGKRGPSRGEIWLDSRLFALLDLVPGDRVTVGESQLRATRVLVSEPDQGGMSSLFAARALMQLDDLAATDVVQPGSRVSYRYLFAGDAAALGAFQKELEPRLEASHEWLDIREAQPAMGQTLERAEAYLLLAASLGVALAGVAVALAARRYGERHIEQVAVMKALGARRGQILRAYLLELLLLVLLASVCGAALGWGLQTGLLVSLRELLPSEVPGAGWRAPLVGAVTALICATVFAMPPIWHLSRVSPMRVLRHDSADSREGLLLSVLLGLVGLAGLMWWYSASIWMTAAVTLGSLALVGLGALVVLSSIRLAKRWGENVSIPRLRLILAAVHRRRYRNAFQVASFSLALMALACLAVLRSSLIADWQTQVEEGAPNHFLINIQTDELPELERFFDERGIRYAGLYPMVRGRISHIDGRQLGEIEGIDSGSANIDREMNLSWARQVPPDNRVLTGQWWQPGDAQRVPLPVSVEQDIAEQLALRVGSRLRFELGGQALEAEVKSLRSLEWASMRPNFYFIFPPESLNRFAGSYITSFYLPPSDKAVLVTLLRQFPTLTLIEIDGILQQLNTVIGQLSAAIALVLASVVVCALLVTIANVQASLDSRLQENALLRTLGASTALIRGGLLGEFFAMGAAAGLLAALGCNLILLGVQYWVLDMTIVWHWEVFFVAPLAGATVFTLTGWAGCRKVVASPPMAVLRG